MKILFLLLDLPNGDKDGGMYGNLAERFLLGNHEVTIMAPDVVHMKTFIQKERGIRILRVASRETQGVNSMYRKGVALATLPYYYKRAYIHYLGNEAFDWIVMPTPPISLSSFARFVKRRSGAKFYMILRDIHPQSVWSIGLLHNRIEYNFLDRKARIGYSAADIIGCMSQGNIDFIRAQYPKLKMGKLVLLYNWISYPSFQVDLSIRKRFGLEGKFVALFGGNLGKGQRIENLLFLAEHYLSNKNIVFLVIAKGVEKERLQSTAAEKGLTNILFKDFMPQSEYLNLTQSVDVGLVSINEYYRVPTCPSKALSYMASGVPVFAMINPGNDFGSILEDAGAGYWAVGSDKTRVVELFDIIYGDSKLRETMSKAGSSFYMNYCTVDAAYHTMISQMREC